jgi:tRNA pseudouridine13 synthase
VRRHRNTLRLGHLQGNRFVIKVRQTEPQRLSELQHALTLLERGGVPNYFGPQRFGYRGDTWATGRAILRGEIDQAIDLMLGCPADCDYGAIRTARELYGRGEYLAAARAWPAMFHTERRALKALAHSGGKRRRAFGSIDNVTRGFYVSAYQSYLFNRIVAARIDTGLDRLWDGDLAWIHASGRVFRVEDAAAEQPRADDFSISPSGPVFGYRMTEPSGQPAELEAAILADEGLRKVTFREAPLQVKGSRRPLRFQPNNSATRLGADERGAYLEATFQLPRGCYATTLLRELFAGPTIDAGATERNGVENHSA